MPFEMKVEGQTQLEPVLEGLIRQAQANLESILRRSAGTVHASWTVRQDDKGRDIVDLLLSDTMRRLNVLAYFDPDELKNPEHLRQRLRDVWGDLLQRQLEDIGNHLDSVMASEGTNP